MKREIDNTVKPTWKCLMCNIGSQPTSAIDFPFGVRNLNRAASYAATLFFSPGR